MGLAVLQRGLGLKELPLAFSSLFFEDIVLCSHGEDSNKPHLGTRGFGCHTTNDGTVILGFLASRAVVNKYVFFISDPNCGRYFFKNSTIELQQS